MCDQDERSRQEAIGKGIIKAGMPKWWLAFCAVGAKFGVAGAFYWHWSWVATFIVPAAAFLALYLVGRLAIPARYFCQSCGQRAMCIGKSLFNGDDLVACDHCGRQSLL